MTHENYPRNPSDLRDLAHSSPLNVSKKKKDQAISVNLSKLAKTNIEKLRAVGVKAWLMQKALVT